MNKLGRDQLCNINKRARMALDRSPEFLRGPESFFLFWSLSGKNLQEFLYVRTEQVAMFINRSKFR